REGLFRTDDGGDSWIEVLEARGLTGYTQVIIEPGNFDVQYAAESGYGIWKSVDAGLSWTLSSDGLGDRYSGSIQVTGTVPGSRFEIGISPVLPSRILALVESESFTDRLYISDDGAASWHPLPESGAGVGPDVGQSQGWYDLTVAAHPYDPDVFFVGGVELYRVTLGGSAQTAARVTVDDSETRVFQDYIDFGGPQLRGGLRAGIDDDESTIVESEMTSVEIRYGAGRSQKAHRFTPPDGPGIDFADYPYADYADVPFEVWDVTNDRQLMVSFRDREADGAYDLTPRNDFNLGREYVLVHAVPYDPDAPDPQISAPGGLPHKLMYFYWPILAQQASWEPETMDPVELRIQFFQSSDGTARTTTEIGRFIHVDQHAIVPIPVNEQLQDFDLVVSNDGGVYFSGDGGQSWIERNSGYNTAQFYGVDRMTGGDRYIGGTQDNGTWSSMEGSDATTPWFDELGGDGFDAVWHSTDANRLLGTIQYNRIRRSVNGGVTWLSATSGLADQGSTTGGAPFVTSLAGAHENPDIVYTIGESGIWKSTDFAETWQLRPVAPADFGFSSGGKVRVSLASDDVVWGGFQLSSGSGATLQLSTDGGETFESVHGPVWSPGRISGLATHPSEPGTAYVLFSAPDRPKVVRTTDFGATWQDLSGFGSPPTKVKIETGFPDVAVYDLLVHPFDQQVLYAGTEIGLFVSDDNGVSWTLVEGNLPATAIWRLKLVDGQVVAATHGRGVWTIPLEAVHSADEEADVVPETFELTSIYPNPFGPSATIEYALDRPAHTEIAVFDLGGRRVATVLDAERSAGVHRIEWRSDGLAAGGYLIRLSGPSGTHVRTVVKVR
ncbi:MAG: T9SS type A sorting domain-containing protein, partial [Rhodothermales bacterium]|nr:T9SS type A sorting domain-containing protein [Rhodothermales bacterium]